MTSEPKSTLTKDERSDRHKRLLRGPIKTFYHQTSEEAASKIMKTGKMLRGSSGMAGGGIYFATTVKHTHHKTHHAGVILVVKVALGNTKKISKNGDYSLTFSKLVKQNYDSVMIPRLNGKEYVVYNYDQVLQIQRPECNEIVNGCQPVINIEVPTNIPICPCRFSLVEQFAKSCYKGSVGCNKCKKSLVNGRTMWHCVAGKIRAHDNGYDLCIYCAGVVVKEKYTICVCETSLEFMLAKNCYPNSTSGVRCNECRCSVKPDEKLWHCPNQKTSLHYKGYDLCTYCVDSGICIKHKMQTVLKIKCVCGQQLRKIQPKSIYTGSASCNVCGDTITTQELMFNCPQKKHKYHLNGYDLCLSCAKW